MQGKVHRQTNLRNDSSSLSFSVSSFRIGNLAKMFESCILHYTVQWMYPQSSGSKDVFSLFVLFLPFRVNTGLFILIAVSLVISTIRKQLDSKWLPIPNPSASAPMVTMTSIQWNISVSNSKFMQLLHSWEPCNGWRSTVCPKVDGIEGMDPRIPS